MGNTFQRTTTSMTRGDPDRGRFLMDMLCQSEINAKKFFNGPTSPLKHHDNNYNSHNSHTISTLQQTPRIIEIPPRVKQPIINQNVVDRIITGSSLADMDSDYKEAMAKAAMKKGIASIVENDITVGTFNYIKSLIETYFMSEDFNAITSEQVVLTDEEQAKVIGIKSQTYDLHIFVSNNLQRVRIHLYTELIRGWEDMKCESNVCIVKFSQPDFSKLDFETMLLSYQLVILPTASTYQTWLNATLYLELLKYTHHNSKSSLGGNDGRALLIPNEYRNQCDFLQKNVKKIEKFENKFRARTIAEDERVKAQEEEDRARAAEERQLKSILSGSKSLLAMYQKKNSRDDDDDDDE